MSGHQFDALARIMLSFKHDNRVAIITSMTNASIMQLSFLTIRKIFVRNRRLSEGRGPAS